MLYLLILIVLMALAAGATGYWVGCVRASRAIAERLQKDPETGKRVLEQLAKQWGAKLELFDLLTEAPPPPPPKG